MYVHHLYGWCIERSEEGIELSGNRVTYGYEPPSGCCESKQGPLQERQTLLTTEPSPALSPVWNYWVSSRTFRMLYH